MHKENGWSLSRRPLGRDRGGGEHVAAEAAGRRRARERGAPPRARAGRGLALGSRKPGRRPLEKHRGCTPAAASSSVPGRRALRRPRRLPRGRAPGPWPWPLRRLPREPRKLRSKPSPACLEDESPHGAATLPGMALGLAGARAAGQSRPLPRGPRGQGAASPAAGAGRRRALGAPATLPPLPVCGKPAPVRVQPGHADARGAAPQLRPPPSPARGRARGAAGLPAGSPCDSQLCSSTDFRAQRRVRRFCRDGGLRCCGSGDHPRVERAKWFPRRVSCSLLCRCLLSL